MDARAHDVKEEDIVSTTPDCTAGDWKIDIRAAKKVNTDGSPGKDDIRSSPAGPYLG
jgi:hypothetical protein